MIMNYEQKYKEALERARNMLSYKEVRQEDMEYIFPELKESEDEIVKRTLIIKFKEWKLSCDEDETWYGLSYDSVIAWLEKQGEKPQGKSIIEAWKDMRLEVYQHASGNRHEPNYSDDKTKMFSLNDIDEIVEKINEQTEKVDNKNCEKPTDKVEPKFMVGDWIISHYNLVARIESIDEKSYFLSCSDGITERLSIDCINRNWRLWTIEDAKDGEVLYSDNGWTCIFKALDNQTNTFSSYCFIDSDKWFCDIGSRCHTLDKAFVNAYNGEIHPATKSQRDLLFQKIKEYGYEWDEDKKELKKS